MSSGHAVQSVISDPKIGGERRPYNSCPPRSASCVAKKMLGFESGNISFLKAGRAMLWKNTHDHSTTRELSVGPFCQILAFTSARPGFVDRTRHIWFM